MSLLVARDIGKSWGDRPVLRSCDLTVDPGDRIGLVGVNGSGKSTLMSILAGELQPDHGSLHLKGTVAVLGQEPVLQGETVGDAVDGAIAWHRGLVGRYEAALAANRMDEAAQLQDQLDERGWQIDHRVDAILDRLRAPGREASLAHLSGGERRRVALAATLLQQPDLLLLDEPTNHLDADTVEWLQSFLLGYRGGVLLVTHDRYLLEAVAERIVEVEDGQTFSYDGSYADYLIARAERHARVALQRSRQLAMIAREAAWASRSPSARGTKQKARLQRLEALQESVPTLSSRDHDLSFTAGVPKGSVLLQATGIEKTLGGRTLFEGVDLSLMPGDRIGILGPNGAGKTTLLRVLLGELAPDAGEVLRGPRSRVGWLDQGRTGLDDEATVFENAGDGNDRVQLGEHWVHVASFLGRFAFGREQFDQKAGLLSGGERARLLLARLMLSGATLLALDEPTNDLDLLTLRVLEEALLDYDGAAVIITHDRAFLDRVCTGVLAFEGEGRVVRYASRTQVLAAAQARAQQQRAQEDRAPAPPAPAPAPAPAPSRPSELPRLSYKEKVELEALPDTIEAREAEQAALEARLADPATYRDHADEVPELNRRLEALSAEVEALYSRWERLSERA